MHRRLAEGTWPVSSSVDPGLDVGGSAADGRAVLVAMASERRNEDERLVCAVIRLSPALGASIHLLLPSPPRTQLRPARQTLGHINHNRAAVSSHSHRGSESPAQPSRTCFPRPGSLAARHGLIYTRYCSCSTRPQMKMDSELTA